MRLPRIFPLSRWMGSIGAIAALIAPMAGHAADPAAGQVVFKINCGVCHSPLPGKNLTGPSLFGIVGRHSGEVPNFHYSVANRESQLIWDEPTLDRYITAPRTVVPGTIMPFPGLPDAAKRADLLAYLATLK